MKRRTIEFVLLAWFYLIIAASMPLQIMFQYQLAPWDVMEIFNKLTTLNLTIITLSLVSAYFAFEASRGILVMAPVFIITVVVNNWLFVIVDANFTAVEATFATFAVTVFHGIMFRPEPIAILRNPHLRWWKVAKRVSIDLHTLVHPATGGDFVAKTYDLSSSGMFVDMQSIKWRQNAGTTVPNKVRQGTHCDFTIRLDNTRQIDCTGIVVRTEPKSLGRYPKGFGVKFVKMRSEDHQALKEFVEFHSDKETIESESFSKAA